MMRWSLLVLVAGCLDAPLVPCGDELCPVDSVCLPDGCASTAAVAACAGLADAAPCTAPAIASGHCMNGVCRASVCGDGRIEFGEVCDDGNTISGDGCSSSCDSNETCGNDVPDFPAGEQCDSGIPFLSGDGCSSKCTIEFPLWRDQTPAGITARAEPAIAYDSVRHRAVVFGGSVDNIPLGDTWEWDGSNWEQKTVVVAPSARFGATLTYDPTSRLSILFGGLDATGTNLADTWGWDGTTWTQLQPATAPSPRSRAAAAYDPLRNQIVLFGGHDAVNMFADTWTWNGTTWTQLSPATSPSKRSGHAMAFDPVHGNVLLYGGTMTSTTWTWDGTTWTAHAITTVPFSFIGCALAYDGQMVTMFGGADGSNNIYNRTWTWSGTDWAAAATLPPARYRANAVYDSADDQLLIVGGDSDTGLGGELADMWADSHGSWTQLPTALTPPHRAYAGMAYDPLRGRTMVFGGGVAPSVRGDLWEWDGEVWVSEPTGPPVRSVPGITYDEAHNYTLVFGGMSNTAPLADTWTWTGTAWTQLAPATSPPGGVNRIVFDDARRRVVGAFVNSTTMLIETWEWDGTTWNPLVTANAPPVRTAFALAYDRARDRVVMFGGEIDPSTFDGDTWEWDGTDWSEVTPAVGPSPRQGALLVYDELRARLVLFGGADAARMDDTWEWDGAVWTRLTLPAAPSPRANVMGAYDRIRAGIVVFAGGQDVPAADTWTYAFQSLDVPRDACFAGLDTDGDGLAGCADPDCWGRCTPLCPPGTTCDPSQPHCGDGVCAPIEDYTLCPTDCPPP